MVHPAVFIYGIFGFDVLMMIILTILHKKNKEKIMKFREEKKSNTWKMIAYGLLILFFGANSILNGSAENIVVFTALGGALGLVTLAVLIALVDVIRALRQ